MFSDCTVQLTWGEDKLYWCVRWSCADLALHPGVVIVTDGQWRRSYTVRAHSFRGGTQGPMYPNCTIAPSPPPLPSLRQHIPCWPLTNYVGDRMWVLFAWLGVGFPMQIANNMVERDKNMFLTHCPYRNTCDLTSSRAGVLDTVYVLSIQEYMWSYVFQGWCTRHCIGTNCVRSKELQSLGLILKYYDSIWTEDIVNVSDVGWRMRSDYHCYPTGSLFM